MIYFVLTVLLMSGPVNKRDLGGNDVIRTESSQWELCKTSPLSVIEIEAIRRFDTKDYPKSFIQCNVLRQLYTQVDDKLVK